MEKEKSKILVLVADDEANLLLLLKDNFEEQGFEVITAVNGEEALQKTIKDKPNMIILDVEMPKLNGFQVCERIRQNPDFKNVPILIFSAYTQPEDIKKGLALGADDYVTKPFKIKDLITTVVGLFNKRQGSK
jgi:two-component system alkaline phosphatase synthesis response regulator PhoP